MDVNSEGNDPQHCGTGRGTPFYRVLSTYVSLKTADRNN